MESAQNGRERDTIPINSAFYWLRKWQEPFKPITKRSTTDSLLRQSTGVGPCARVFSHSAVSKFALKRTVGADPYCVRLRQN